ncbi:MAG: sarcosine oxidase subunit gamma [Rhodobacteraceae bacterium]|nr:sarcosine oxidase subunit gamma [Paracoccaceae bacterium]
MPDFTLTEKPALGGFDHDFDGTSLKENVGLAIVSVAIPLGGDDAVAEALKSAYGADTPVVGDSSLSKDGATRIIRTATDQLFVLFQHETPDAAQIVAGKLGDAGYYVDQTHNWVGLTLDGPLSRAALERVCAMNLHKDRFPLNKAERTVMEHMGAIVARTGEDAFLLLSASSSAGSYLHAIETSLKYVS